MTCKHLVLGSTFSTLFIFKFISILYILYIIIYTSIYLFFNLIYLYFYLFIFLFLFLQLHMSGATAPDIWSCGAACHSPLHCGTWWSAG